MARFDIGFVNSLEIAGSMAPAEALFDLGLKYSMGRGVERNLVEAHKFFNLAALGGIEAAREYRKEISSEMSSDEIAEAQRCAREWMATIH